MGAENAARGLTASVSSLSPLAGAIDGSPRKRPRRATPRVLPPQVSGAWICPACGRTTSDATDQAKHVASELYRATLRLTELELASADLADSIRENAPDFSIPAARLLLTEDDCKRAHSAFTVLRRRKMAMPASIWHGHNEYMRRKQAEYRVKWATASDGNAAREDSA